MKLKILFLFLVSLFTFQSILPFQQLSDEVTFDSLYQNVKFYSKKKENLTALVYSKKLLSKAIQNKNIWQKAKSYNKIAEFCNKLNIKDSAYYYHIKSNNLYLEINDSIQIGRNLLNIAIIESNFGSYSLSDSTAVESIRYINGKRNRTTASAYNCLAINSKKRFLYEDAKTYYEIALNFVENNNSKLIYKTNLANVYKELKVYSKSILILESLKEDSIANKKTKARIIDNLAHIKWLSNSKDIILNELLLAKSIREKENYKYDLMASNSHLFDYFKEINERKSLFYAYEMYTIAKGEKSIQDQLEAIDKIIELETSQKSTKYFKESMRLRDSLQKEETKRQYKFAKIKYDYEEEEKKKLQFKALAAENKLIAEQENNQKKNILILAIVSICGLSFLLYRRKQQQHRKILEANYKTEIRIAKKIHDELGNDIFNVISKVQNTAYKEAEIVEDLDKLYLQTRTISHGNDVIKTGKDFENYFNQLIASYHSNDCKIILKDLSVLELNSLKEEQQRALYRVFNELFVNLKKHSKANLVVIACKKANKFLEIRYADNGVGFKNNKVVLKNGLTNMETRIKSIGGTLNFESETNKGLKLKIRFKK